MRDTTFSDAIGELAAIACDSMTFDQMAHDLLLHYAACAIRCRGKIPSVEFLSLVAAAAGAATSDEIERLLDKP